MLLTLAISSLKSMLGANGSGRRLTALEVPRFAREELGLHALNVPASMLRGWRGAQLEELRDVADKAACPCLLLVDDEPLDLGADGEKARLAATTRFSALATAAGRLGCNSLAIGCKGPTAGSEPAFDRTVGVLKSAFSSVDRLELNVLLRPCPGMLEDPVRLTEMIKRVGGFRIGSLPDFAHAQRTGDAELALRRLAPYAGAIHATIVGFGPDGKHSGCDLATCVEAIQSVGYQNTLAIEFVGTGDPVEAILRARDVLAEAISGVSNDGLADLAAALAGDAAGELVEGAEGAEADAAEGGAARRDGDGGEDEEEER